jgi:hypothetical protein
MATKKITQLTSLAQVDVANANDVLAIVDLGASETKKVTPQALVGSAASDMVATWNSVLTAVNGGGVDKAFITKAGTMNIAGALVVSSVSTLTGAVTAVSSVKSTSATAGVGYGTGAGGAVTQATSKSTGVTLDKVCGEITMNNATLNRETAVSFTLTNSAIAATDVVVVNIKSAATANAYNVAVTAVAAGSCRIQVHNLLGGSDLSEALVLSFAVIKAVAA